METLVKLAAPAIGTAAGAFTVVGIIYLGMTLAGLLRGGGGEIRKAVAIIVAGLTCIAFELQTATASIHFFPEQPALHVAECRVRRHACLSVSGTVA